MEGRTCALQKISWWKAIELSRVLHTSPNYLLGMEDYEEDLLEIITVYKNLKGSKTKQIALEQMKLLATMSSEL